MGPSCPVEAAKGSSELGTAAPAPGAAMPNEDEESRDADAAAPAQELILAPWRRA